MNPRIEHGHRARRAVVYVRQSSMAQVFENTESTSRQYALKQRAMSLGWCEEDIVVIDEDLGLSGASAEHRRGFAHLTDEVVEGRVGAILALEVSRLARSSADWQQLMRLCAVADVLVIDENAVYDPSVMDDRLLLDLKGTMSEAELHWLGLRLVGARRSKAKRGQLWFRPPTGYIWEGSVLIKDPDDAIRRSIEVLFARFEVEASAWAVVRWARRQGFEMPTRRFYAGGHTEVIWRPLGASRLCWMLHNPAYAGIYSWGRGATVQLLVDGKIRRVRRQRPDAADWVARVPEAHEGYITGRQFKANQQKLRDNQTGGALKGAPREGRALLGGLLVCGRCGRRMQPTYHRDPTRWRYLCAGDRNHAGGTCWSLEGNHIDEAVVFEFLAAATPAELDLSLAVEQEATDHAESLEASWRARIERAEYAARLAERRYMAVDPDNRVVARNLESSWELRLRELQRVQHDFEDAKREHRVVLTDADRARIRALASDLDAVWQAPTTRNDDRQAMLRLAVEAVALEPIDVPDRATRVRIAWKGGTATERLVPRPGRGDNQRISRGSLERLGVLVSEGLHDEEIVAQMNTEGALSTDGRPWTVSALGQTRRRYKLRKIAPDRPRIQRLPPRFPNGRFSVRGLAVHAGVTEAVVRGWIRQSLLDVERTPHGSYPAVWKIRLHDGDLERIRSHRSQTTARKARLPDRHPDGRFSVPGLVRLYEVNEGTVRNWIRRGLFRVDYEAFGVYPRIRWLTLNEDREPELREWLDRIRRRRAARNRSKDTTS